MIKELTPSSIAELQYLVDTFDVSFEDIKDKIINVLILPRIDEITDENLLDLLGWQFHIEGYDKAENIQEKRNLIKNAIELHRYKGTPYAIKKVLESLNLDAELQEWFNYNGNPYMFKVLVKSAIQDENTYKKLAELINEYKNQRSWLDTIGFHREYTNNVYYANVITNGKNYKIGLHIDTTVENNNLYIGMTERYATSYQIGIYNPQASIDNNNLYIGITQRIASYMSIYPASGG
jgi:phage tail P2-like protein